MIDSEYFTSIRLKKCYSHHDSKVKEEVDKVLDDLSDLISENCMRMTVNHLNGFLLFLNDTGHLKDSLDYDGRMVLVNDYVCMVDNDCRKRDESRRMMEWFNYVYENKDCLFR